MPVLTCCSSDGCDKTVQQGRTNRTLGRQSGRVVDLTRGATYRSLAYGQTISCFRFGRRNQTIITSSGRTQGTIGYCHKIQKDVSNMVHTILINNSRLPHGISIGGRKKRSYETMEIIDSDDRKPGDTSMVGRDPHLKQVLEISSDEDLRELYDCLHAVSVFSPLAKSIQLHDFHKEDFATARREDIEFYIESRFRFLAADARHLLHPIHSRRGETRMADSWPSYRDTLLDIRKQLRVPCPGNLDTVDLEIEIFLHLLSEHGEYVQHGTTGSTASSGPPHPSGPHKDNKSKSDDETFRTKTQRSNSHENEKVMKKSAFWSAFRGSIVSPLSFGFRKELLPTLVKTVTTMALTKSQMNLIQNLGSIVLKRAAHHKSIAFIYGGSTELAKRMAIENAKQRLIKAAMQYTAWRQLFSFIGPILWISTAWDLTKLSVGTDYARLTRTVFLLAQIRLLRTRGWH